MKGEQMIEPTLIAVDPNEYINMQARLMYYTRKAFDEAESLGGQQNLIDNAKSDKLPQEFISQMESDMLVGK